MFEEGVIYQIGEKKFRAVLSFGDEIAFVIFERDFETNRLKTVGVTTRKKSEKWD